MLKAIQKYDKKSREAILSDIALELGRPSLGDDLSLNYLSNNEDYHQNQSFINAVGAIWSNQNTTEYLVIREIVDSLNVKNTEDLHTTKSKVLNFLGRELRSIALDSGKIRNARKRLGQKGVLPPNSYSIKITSDFKEICIPLGITENEVALAVSAAEMVEHLMPEIQGLSEALSLFVKSFPNNGDPYSLLVDTRRVEDSINVHFAIRMYHSDFDTENITKPTELLKVFIDLFGSEISINDESSRLHLYKRLPTGTSSYFVKNASDNDDFVIRASHYQLKDGTTEVSIAYGLNQKLYIDYLRKHNVKVKQKAGDI